MKEPGIKAENEGQREGGKHAGREGQRGGIFLHKILHKNAFCTTAFTVQLKTVIQLLPVEHSVLGVELRTLD